MIHNHRLVLLTTAVLAIACDRPRAPQHRQSPDSPQAESTRATAPPSLSPEDAVAVMAPSRDTTHPAPPRPAHGVDGPPTDTGHTPVAPAPSGEDTAVVSAPLRDAYHQPPLDTVDARTYQGWKYYNLYCARCHGEDVSGTTIAPHLILSLKPDGTVPDAATFRQTVCAGRPEKGMPAWCTLGLTPLQIDTMYAYIKGRSDAKLHPGRPARRIE